MSMGLCPTGASRAREPRYYDLLKVFDIHNTMENEKFIEIYMYKEELLCETEESD